jgi:hypothetical protein
MKVFQCLQKYAPHIPSFEKKYGIEDKTDITFEDLRKLLIEDGYASTYILKPALENKTNDVFYTIWDYKRLQMLWAKENGLKSKELDEIKLAQIEAFKPDVFYNHSPYYDGDFVRKIQHNKELIKVCWDAIITHNPSFHENYNLRFTLFEPYVKLWNQHGYNANLLPPAFPDSWELLKKNQKDIDILFYGQYGEYFFSERNDMLKEIVPWAKKKGFHFKMHLQGTKQKRSLINIRGIRRFTSWWPIAPKIITDNALAPIYGQQLYETIARSKIVINAFTNYNGLFKDNMRNYETIGGGALLIGDDGIYPEHFIPNVDFLTYKSKEELFDKIESVLALPDQGLEMAQRTRKKLKSIYSKENQWKKFQENINAL